MRWRSTLAVLAMLLMAAGALLPAAEQVAAVDFNDWDIENLEASNGGLSADIAVASDDSLHAVYPLKNPVCVRYAVNVEGRWTKVSLRTEVGEVRHVSIALDGKDTPHILYTVLYRGVYKLKHVTMGELDWVYTAIDQFADVGEAADIAVDTHNVPHVTFTNATTNDLKYSKWTGSAFFVETVDAPATVTTRPTIDTDSHDRAHVAYYDDLGQKFKEAFFNTGRWTLRTIDTGASTGHINGIAVDADDNAHVSYISGSPSSLRYAVWTGTEFATETVDGGTDTGYSNSIDLAADGTPHIIYRTLTPAKIKHAQLNGTVWQKVVVDEQPGAVRYISQALNRTAYPHIVYSFTTGDVIKHARPFPNQDPVKPAPASGPVTGVRDTDYEYTSTPDDPDADPVRLVFDWGNGQTTETPLALSGQAVAVTYSWAVSGTYSVRVRAVDVEGGTSPWSDSLVVVINAPPHTPPRPQGPFEGQVGVAQSYSVSAIDPDDDSMRLRIDWDEPEGTPPATAFTETNIVTSGTVVNVTHTWAAPGNYEVRVRAIDVWSAESEWGPARMVSISRAPTAPTLPAGPVLLLVGQNGTFTTSSTDPDGDAVHYEFELGPASLPGATINTTDPLASGATATLVYNWSSGGVRTLKVRAIDVHNVSSAWSLSLDIRVNTRPVLPQMPAGLKRLLEKEEGVYTASSTDVDGNRIKYVFDWGDGNVTSGGPLETELLASGSTGALTHKWSKPGTYLVAVKVVDEYGGESDWSDIFVVNVHADVTWWESNGIYVIIAVVLAIVVALVLVMYMRGGKEAEEVDIAKLIELDAQMRAGGGGAGGTGDDSTGATRPLP